VIDPFSIWTAVYNLPGQTGVGDYWINPGAGLGLNGSGTLTVYYQGFDCNPNVCGSPIETDGTASATFNVSTQSPEPSSVLPLALLGAGWAAFALRRRFAK
jgi:hypothetical protein